MITNEQLEATYHQMRADSETEIDGNDKPFKPLKTLGGIIRDLIRACTNHTLIPIALDSG